MIRIVTDSTSSIPLSLRDSHDVRVLSLFVNRDGVEYEESSMDLDSFYADIYDMIDSIPTSSQPALFEFESAFEQAAEANDDVIGLFLSSRMSGTFESAVRAARETSSRHPSFRCAVVDSTTNCMELGWSVLAVAEAAAEGADFAACVEMARERIRCTRFIFSPESLRFLEKGGRIGKAAALLGNALRISPILTVKDGEASTFAKVRTQKKARAKMLEILERDAEAYGLKNVAVHYIGSREPAERWASESIIPFVGHEVAILPASPVIGVHVGPAVGIAYECERPIEGKFEKIEPEVVLFGPAD